MTSAFAGCLTAFNYRFVSLIAAFPTMRCRLPVERTISAPVLPPGWDQLFAINGTVGLPLMGPPGVASTLPVTRPLYSHHIPGVIGCFICGATESEISVSENDRLPSMSRLFLTLLARVYNTDVRNLLDCDDHQHLPRTDRLLLAKNREFYGPTD